MVRDCGENPGFLGYVLETETLVMAGIVTYQSLTARGRKPLAVSIAIGLKQPFTGNGNVPI
jgi:hypothetical protein